MRVILAGAIAKNSEIVVSLRPPILEIAGIADAVGWEIQEFEKYSRLEVRYESEVDDLRMDDMRTLTVFRVVQEALRNVARHANATLAEVKITRRDSWLLVEIKDDGIGFSPEDPTQSASFGILGMRERAIACCGNFRIDIGKGHGTTVTLTIPLGP